MERTSTGMRLDGFEDRVAQLLCGRLGERCSHFGHALNAELLLVFVFGFREAVGE